jgi:hypothetical protein
MLFKIFIASWTRNLVEISIFLLYHAGAPYGVRPARPRSYLDFEKLIAAAAAAARRRVRGLI